MLFYQVIEAFDKAGLKYAVVGGYALALHGIVRATVDIDLILSLNQKDYQLAEQILGTLGLKSRLPISATDVIKMRQEYITHRNLIAWAFVDYANPARQVDILITKDLKFVKTQNISVRGMKIRVATLEELLKMKQKSARPQDLVDIQSIKQKLDEKA